MIMMKRRLYVWLFSYNVSTFQGYPTGNFEKKT